MSITSALEIFSKATLITFFGVLLMKCEFLKSWSLVTTTKSFSLAYLQILASEVCHFSNI